MPTADRTTAKAGPQPQGHRRCGWWERPRQQVPDRGPRAAAAERRAHHLPGHPRQVAGQWALRPLSLQRRWPGRTRRKPASPSSWRRGVPGIGWGNGCVRFTVRGTRWMATAPAAAHVRTWRD